MSVCIECVLLVLLLSCKGERAVVGLLLYNDLTGLACTQSATTTATMLQ
jgi:hypothetical protein